MTIDWKDIIATTLDRWNGCENVELRVVKTQAYGPIDDMCVLRRRRGFRTSSGTILDNIR